MVGGAAGWALAALVASLLPVAAASALTADVAVAFESVVAATGAVAAVASVVLAAGAVAELVSAVAVGGLAAGATVSEVAGFVAVVSVWDSAPCCQTRHPSSVAISIFVFILLSPIRLRLVFMLNMNRKILVTPGYFWQSPRLLHSMWKERFMPACIALGKSFIHAGWSEMKAGASIFGIQGLTAYFSSWRTPPDSIITELSLISMQRM